MNKLILKATLLLAAALALPISANATVYWDWTWTTSDARSTDSSGTLTTVDLSARSYLITAMTGTWNGYVIDHLLDTGRLENNSNLLLDDSPQLDMDGVAFETVLGKTNIRYSDDLSAYFWRTTGGDGRTRLGEGVGTFTATQVAAVPEPETYALMLAGLAVVGAAACRRRARA